MNPLEKIDNAIKLLGTIGNHALSIKKDAEAAKQAVFLLTEAAVEIRKSLNNPNPAPAA